MKQFNSTKEIVDFCSKLYFDLDLNYVKQWKERNPKRRAIGFLPVYVPKELIHAAQMLPVGLSGAGDQLEIIKGDAYFQSYICHIPRSTIELAVSHRMDHLDGFLFPAICDVIRNLSGMFKTIFPNKYVKYVDFPQNFQKAGHQFYQYEMKTLLSDFSKLAGVEITTTDINNSIKIYNKSRRLINTLYQRRIDFPHEVPSYELYLLMRASNILTVEEHNQLVENYLQTLEQSKGSRGKRDNIRVVVSGLFCEQPPLGLIKALELSGCYIVEDDWVLGARYITSDIEESRDDPLRELSDAYINKAVATASRYEESHLKGKFLIKQVQESNAEGVIFCAPSFCDPALLERPMLHNALTKANIDYTSLKYAENSGQFQVIKEQAGTFADSIKLWG